MPWLDRLLRRDGRAGRGPSRTRGPVELDVHQQLAARALRRFGPCSFARLCAEVDVVRPVTPAQMVQALFAMESAGVIERVAERGGTPTQSHYALTRRGRRLARWIPAEPRSAMAFYV